MKCPACGNGDHKKIRAGIIDEKLGYGVKADLVFLDVKLPVYQCTLCEVAWTDEEGERRRAEAVDAYKRRKKEKKS